MSPMPFRLALWPVDLSYPVESLAAWATLVEAQARRARAEGADLLVMPEYCSEQWLSYAPSGLPGREEIAWMAGQTPAAVAALRGGVERTGVAILAGTMPVRAETPRSGQPPWVNRAHLLLPDGRMLRQDKLCLTPFERDPDSWNLDVGAGLELVTWRGVKIAVLVCLDVELPALSCLLAPHQPDLVLVPSETERLAGYHRVFNCAKARAVELQAVVAVVGVVGAAATGKPRGGYVSGAGVYAPCEEVLGNHGVLAELPPATGFAPPGPLLFADLPLATLNALREGKAEVWPGAWDGGGIAVAELAGTEPTAC